jgi:hypothetical protein
MRTAERPKLRQGKQGYGALQEDRDARHTDMVFLAAIIGTVIAEILLLVWLCR